MALKPPVEVPQGAIRLNTDSQKLEFFAQDQWWQMATDVPTLDGGARGVIRGGQTPSSTNVIEYVTIPVASNSTDFGDTIITGTRHVIMSNSSRGVIGSDGSITNALDYITFATTGNSLDFGDQVSSSAAPVVYSFGGCSDSHGGIS